MGVEHHHQWEEELWTVPFPERQNGAGINQPIETGGGPPQPPNGVSGGTRPTTHRKG